MRISIASDHAGFRFKEQIKHFLVEEGHEVRDFGTDSEASCDYPLFIRPAAEAVASGAGAKRGVEREQPRFDLRNGEAGNRTGKLLGENNLVGLGFIARDRLSLLAASA